MKIHCLCVVKNEADIIEQTLRSAAKWSDWIYVLDNGSSDGTWQKVRELARELRPVTPYRQDPQPFEDAIRGEILREYKSRARHGDWWCILDADEFYIDDPREFLKRVPRHFKAVWMQLYVYLFTDRDADRFRQDPEIYDSIPIEQRLRHYVLGDYSELRFFRHSSALTHVPAQELHPIYPRRIRVKHYAYRSPQQIRLRLATRLEPMQRGEFLHEKRGNWVPGGTFTPGPAQAEDIGQSWEDRIASSAECQLDHGDGVYADADVWIPPKPPGWSSHLRSRGRLLLGRARGAKRRLLGV